MASNTRADELRIGVAVADADADAVAMDGRDRVLAQASVASDGLSAVLASLIQQLIAAPGVDAARVTRVMLGTGLTLTRALEGGGVDRVAVIRIGGPLTHAVPPLVAWPAGLRDAVSAGEVVVRGGAEYDGRVAHALDDEHIARFLETVADIDGVAITGVFSPVAPEHEIAAAAVVRRERGSDIRISLSHELGMLGLIERENGTVLNAALGGEAHRIADEVTGALRTQGIAGEPFLARGNGALMALAPAQRLPLLILDSAPATAMRGAVHLTGAGDAVVVNAGATAIEVGTVVNGRPRDTGPPLELSGVRVGLRMPDVRRVSTHGDGRALAEAVTWAGADLRSPPVLVVGHAAGVVSGRLTGIGRVVRPGAGEVAAAVGAATGQVRGGAERIAADRPDRRQEALEAATEAATVMAVHAGADPERVQVIGVDETPLTYGFEPTVRISVFVAGPPV